METRINYVKAAPDGFKAMVGLESYISHSGIEPMLLHLVKMRASQINGCAYCLDMHSKDLRAGGETEQRIYGLNAWHESPFYTDRERAALAWTEALTKVADTHAPDDVYESSRKHFTEKEFVDLTWAIAAINAWNRMGIGFRSQPGNYVARGANK
ncbi:MAG TPA: carboxymuconolactone decarboxylase family protein [Tepidisphaeraceae bacterium]|jgi:AhpD family alkylhydroperoxidase|nr:carboxymuconolactone decarboxylase family protein [Tepidisphaeraceae bacterium]